MTFHDNQTANEVEARPAPPSLPETNGHESDATPVASNRKDEGQGTPLPEKDARVEKLAEKTSEEVLGTTAAPAPFIQAHPGGDETGHFNRERMGMENKVNLNAVPSPFTPLQFQPPIIAKWASNAIQPMGPFQGIPGIKSLNGAPIFGEVQPADGATVTPDKPRTNPLTSTATSNALLPAVNEEPPKPKSEERKSPPEDIASTTSRGERGEIPVTTISSAIATQAKILLGQATKKLNLGQVRTRDSEAGIVLALTLAAHRIHGKYDDGTITPARIAAILQTQSNHKLLECINQDGETSQQFYNQAKSSTPSPNPTETAMAINDVPELVKGDLLRGRVENMSHDQKVLCIKAFTARWYPRHNRDINTLVSREATSTLTDLIQAKGGIREFGIKHGRKWEFMTPCIVSMEQLREVLTPPEVGNDPPPPEEAPQPQQLPQR